MAPCSNPPAALQARLNRLLPDIRLLATPLPLVPSLSLWLLDRLVDEWRPHTVAHSRPSGIHWPVPSLELLEEALAEWSRRQNLPLYAYTAQEVRSSIAGQPNASQDQLAFAVMEPLGLIGLSKTAHEWEALAVGEYHLAQAIVTPTPSPVDLP